MPITCSRDPAPEVPPVIVSATPVTIPEEDDDDEADDNTPIFVEVNHG